MFWVMKSMGMVKTAERTTGWDFTPACPGVGICL
jgi:hypothetical protein